MRTSAIPTSVSFRVLFSLSVIMAAAVVAFSGSKGLTSSAMASSSMASSSMAVSSLASSSLAYTEPAARGERRAGSFVSTGYAVSASGRLSPADFAALNRPMVSLRNPSGSATELLRSAEITIASTADAAATGTVRVYQVKRGVAPLASGSEDFNLALLGEIGYTLGSITGPTTTGVVTTSERLAVSVTWTPATSGTSPPGISDYVTSAYGGTGVVRFSPGGSTPARLLIGDCGNAEWLLFDAPSTSGKALTVIAETGT